MKLHRLTLILVGFLFSQFLTAQIGTSLVLNNQTKVSLVGDNLVKSHQVEILIASAKDKYLADVSLFSSRNFKLEGLSANIKTLDGDVIRKLKKKDIHNTMDFSEQYSFFSDSRTVEFTMYHDQYPYILEYSYQHVSSNYLTIANWRPHIKQGIHHVNASLKVTLPKSYNVTISQQGIDSVYTQTNGEEIVYIFENKNYINEFKRERFSPVYRYSQPFVKLTADHFFYQIKGDASSWEKWGDWDYAINKNLLKLTFSEQQIIDDLIKDCNSEREKIKILYHYLQENTRYVSISINNGGYVPYSADYVCQHRYGDCKALTIYMKAMLKYVGIESYYALINSGMDAALVDVKHPSPQFNHVILCIPLAKDTVWLENTSKTAPFNYVGVANQNRLAFLVDDGTSRFVKTPSFSGDEYKSSYKTDIFIDPEGEATFKSKNTMKGRMFDYIKSFNNYISASNQSNIVNKLGLVHKAHINNFDIIASHRDSAFIDLLLEGECENLCENIGNSVMLHSLRPFGLGLEHPTKRQSPLKLYYPFNTVDSIYIHFDKSISDVKGLSNKSIINDFGEYNFSYEIQDTTLLLVNDIYIKQSLYPLSEYEACYDFIKEIERTSNKKYLIKF